MNLSTTALRAFTATAALALASVASADIQFRVQLDTSSLISNPSGPFSLDFQLNDGSGWGDANNWATISNLTFGGGSPTGSASTMGGAWGDLGSSVALVDSDPLLNDFTQGFTPGSWLSFDVHLSTNVDSGGTPDEFSFAILDGNFFNLPTNSLGTDTFVQVALDSANPTILIASSVDGAIAAPTVTPVPEASTYGLMGAALLGLVALKRRRSAK
ncbi:MAG TPA: NF038129 family PEP-CTERM protein [Opitutaceae bacterium]